MKNFENKLNKLLFVIILILNLSISWDNEKWIGLGDPWDYLKQSEFSIFDKKFYFPEKEYGFYPRPFTVPLFYKLAGRNPDTIIQLQKVIHSISIFFLVTVFLLYVKNKKIKLFIILFLYLFQAWWNILGWSILLLSESLSISLLICWIASFLLFYKKRKNYQLILHMIIMVLFSFTRDNVPYFLLSFYFFTGFLSYFINRKRFQVLFGFLFLTIILFFIQQHSAQVGQRYRLPLLNTIIIRILPNADYVQWFSDKGMPCIDELIENYSGLNYKDRAIYALYNDSRFDDLFEWINKSGKNVYMKFLITHPRYSLLLEENIQSLKRIFSYNLDYTGKIRQYAWMSQYIFPVFSFIGLIIYNISLIYLFLKKKKLVFLIPVVLTVSYFLNTILIYNADSLEVERHMFITGIMIQILGILSVSIILDTYIQDNFHNKKPVR